MTTATMTTATMTTPTMIATGTPAVTSASAAFTRARAAVTTAARFLGHLLAALVGVAFLGRDLEH